MEIEGTIVFDLPLQEGVSKAGNPWKKKEWVLETSGAYPKKVKFTVFGDRRVTEMPFEVGKAYRISVELESREFNGRWYTDVNAFSAMPIEGGMMAAPQGGMNAGMQGAAPAFGQPAPMEGLAPASPADPFAGANNDTDDLPF